MSASLKVMLVFPAMSIEGRQDYLPVVPPLGIAYLAAALLPRCEVAILDAVAEGSGHTRPARRLDLRLVGLAPSEIIERVMSFQPDVLGVSTMFASQLVESLELCRLAKSARPQTKTVLGGITPTFFPQRCLASGSVDYVVRGEGEPPLVALLSALEQGSSPEGIPGLCCARGNSIHIDPRTEPSADIESLPLPARGLLPMELYFKLDRPVQGREMGGRRHRRNTTMITSRGCPFKCSFCAAPGFWGGKHRMRSVQSIISEMQQLWQKHGVREIQFMDDNLLLDRRKASQLFREMSRSLPGLCWCAPNGVSPALLDDEMIELMAESGCYALSLAIESGSQEVLDSIIHKPLKLSGVREVIRKAQRRGILLNGYFVIGFPGETLEQMARTISFALDCGVDIPCVFVATPAPGSPLYDECLKSGLIAHESQWEPKEIFFPDLPLCGVRPERISAMISRFYLRSFLNLALRRPALFLRMLCENLLEAPSGFAMRNAQRILSATGLSF